MDDQGTYFDDLWSYSINNDNWLLVSSEEIGGRKGGVSFVHNAALFYTTGILSTNLRLNDTWKFQAQNSVEIIKQLDVKVYPNPAMNIIHIDCEVPISEVEIINSLGKSCLKTTKAEISTAHLENGFYFLKIQLGEILIVKHVEIFH